MRAAVETLAPTVGLAPACRALGVARASVYRHRTPRVPKLRSSRRPSPRALAPRERTQVLDMLHEDRFVDRAPAAVYATLLEEGRYLCSIRTMYRVLHDAPVIQTWMMQTPQRRMASCIPAMVAHYRERMGLSEEDLSEDISLAGADASDAQPDTGDIATRLRRIVSNWPADGEDSKYAGLQGALRRFDETEPDWKCLIFAFYKGTLRYLSHRLASDGFNNLILSGDTPVDERQGVIERFRDDEDIRILLSSRVGSEGLDFQFCDTMFNYDLPWNPMEVEQRIGRLDRIGQESEVIRIYSLSVVGTIEQRILERLYNRIQIFERSIGEIEDILGNVVRELEWDLLSRRLSPEEEDRRITQAVLVIGQRWEQLRGLESTAAQLVGVDQFFEEEVSKILDRRRYVTGRQLERYVVDFLRNECPNTRLEADQDEGQFRLLVAEDLREFLGASGVRHADTPLMRGGRMGVIATFDSDVAFGRPNLEFLNVLHPLVQAITKHHGQSEEALILASHVRLKTDIIPAGYYYFFVLKVIVEAVRDSSTLEVILLDQDLCETCSQEEAEGVLGLMVEAGEEAVGGRLEVNPDAASAAWHCAEKAFVARLEATRRELERSNGAFLDRRLASVRAFWERKMAGQQKRLEEAELRQRESRYIRMVQGTLRRLEREFADTLAELQTQRSIEVSYNEVAAGILEVGPDTG